MLVLEEFKVITKVNIIDTEDNSFMIASSSIVTHIGNGFLELTGYSKDDLVNKDISEVFTRLLRLPQKTFEQINIKDNIECYIFTKFLEVREVTISVTSVLQGQKSKNKIYYVVEKPNSRLEDKLIFEEQLFKDNIVGCSIYSVPDLILLKSNQKHLDFMDPSYNTMEKCIGLSLWESVPGYEGSNSEELFLTIMKTGIPNYYNEFKYDHYERGTTYWDGSVIPIYSDKKVKYIFQTCTEITDKIADRNQIEEQAKIIKFQNIQLNHQNKLLKRQLNLLNLSTEAIFAWDLYGAITYWNMGAERMYGYSSEEAVGRVSHDLLKTVRPSEIGDIKSMLTKDGAWKGEIEHTCKDGRKLIVETSHQVIMDDQGQHIVLETNRDITERRRAEEAERESRVKLEAALASMTDAVFISDAEGRFVNFNDAFSTFHKFRNKDECLKTLAEYPDVLDVFTADGKLAPLDGWAVSRALRGESVTNAEYILRRKDTGETWVGSYSFGPIRGENGAIVGSVVAGRDITEQKKAETNLIQSTQRLNAILESIQDGFFELDQDWRFSYINQRAARNGGFEPEDLLGECIWDKFPHLAKSKLKEMYTEVMDNRLPVASEINSLISDQWYEISVYPSLSGISAFWRDITERKQIEDNLRRSELDKSNILDSISDAFFTFNREWQVTYWNNAAEKMFNLKREEILGKIFWEVFPKSIGSDFYKQYNYAMKENLPVTFETLGVYTGYWAEVRAYPSLGGLTVYLHNITERKLAEMELNQYQTELELQVEERTKELVKTNQKVTDIINSISDGFFALDSELRFTFVNQAAEIIIGLPREALIGRILGEFPNVSPIMFEKYHQVLSEKVPQIYEFLSQPTQRWIEVNVYPASNGITVYFRDISERKCIEKEMAKHTRELSNQAKLLNLAHDYIIARDKNSAITFWNTSAEIGYGWNQQEALGKNKHEFLKTQFLTAFEEVQNELLTNGSWEGELIHTKKDGTQLIVESRQSVIRDIYGEPVEFLEINRDITERKKIEKEMARIDRLNLVGQMAAGIGHEVRNPMTTVRGFLQLLGSKEEYSKHNKYFALMIGELDRANSIITEFLSVAKDKVIELEVQSLNKIVENILPLIQSDATISDKYIHMELEEVSEIALDKKEIHQLIINLVRNGLEAMSPGGNMKIRTFMDKEETVLSVQDEGNGIPLNVLEKIGTPFFTTKENGTGLGLAVCYSIAARHNAKIDIKTDSTGTTFLVRFKMKH